MRGIYLGSSISTLRTGLTERFLILFGFRSTGLLFGFSGALTVVGAALRRGMTPFTFFRVGVEVFCQRFLTVAWLSFSLVGVAQFFGPFFSSLPVVLGAFSEVTMGGAFLFCGWSPVTLEGTLLVLSSFNFGATDAGVFSRVRPCALVLL